MSYLAPALADFWTAIACEAPPGREGRETDRTDPAPPEAACAIGAAAGRDGDLKGAAVLKLAGAVSRRSDRI